MNFEYQAIVFQPNLKRKLGSSDQQLTQVLNHMDKKGWDFVSFDYVEVKVPAGCLFSLLGQGPSFEKIPHLIFRKKK